MSQTKSVGVMLRFPPALHAKILQSVPDYQWKHGWPHRRSFNAVVVDLLVESTFADESEAESAAAAERKAKRVVRGGQTRLKLAPSRRKRVRK